LNLNLGQRHVGKLCLGKNQKTERRTGHQHHHSHKVGHEKGTVIFAEVSATVDTPPREGM